MTDIDPILLKGIALRGEFSAAADELKDGFILPDGPILVRDIGDRPLGKADVSLVDGDIVVEAQILPRQVAGIMYNPFFCVAMAMVDGKKPELSFILVTDAADDPLQMPYRVTYIPEDCKESLASTSFIKDYRQVMVVDVAHDVEIGMDDKGALSAIYDESKSHPEWVHKSEYIRQNLPNAVARGFGYKDWTELKTDDTNTELAMNILKEVVQFI